MARSCATVSAVCPRAKRRGIKSRSATLNCAKLRAEATRLKYGRYLSGDALFRL
ncbi:hypothetical protein F504_1750 [Ralstonia pseudosolanacearum FQY_4]|nr:hypothetical protein F504_1750 [Ralstonia pseudosolanacearum FQY_4]